MTQLIIPPRPALLDTPHQDMLIGGQRVPALSGQRFETRNPATGDLLATVAQGGAEDVDRAVQAARRALEDGPWSRMSARQRGQFPPGFQRCWKSHERGGTRSR